MNSGDVSQPVGHKLLIATTPGPLGTWVTKVAKRIVEAIVGGPIAEAELDSDEATDKYLSTPHPESSVLVSRFPRPDLVSYVQRVGGAAVVVIDDPLDVVAQYLSMGTPTAPEVIRPLSQSLALLDDVRRLNRVATVGPDCLQVPAHQFIARLALSLGAVAQDSQALSLAFKGWRMGTVAESISAVLFPGNTLEGRRAGLSAHDIQLVEGAVRGLMALVLGQTAQSVIWNYSLFFDGKTKTSPAPHKIEMTGPARCLYYGPYISLPVGQWEGSVYLGLSDDISETNLRVDACAPEIEAVFLSRLKAGGVYRVPIRFSVRDARRHVEIRVFIDRGEIDGVLVFKQVTLRRQELE